MPAKSADTRANGVCVCLCACVPFFVPSCRLQEPRTYRRIIRIIRTGGIVRQTAEALSGRLPRSGSGRWQQPAVETVILF